MRGTSAPQKQPHAQEDRMSKRVPDDPQDAPYWTIDHPPKSAPNIAPPDAYAEWLDAQIKACSTQLDTDVEPSWRRREITNQRAALIAARKQYERWHATKQENPTQ